MPWLPRTQCQHHRSQSSLNVLPSSSQACLTSSLEPKMKFVQELTTMPVAINTSDANEQHYEVRAQQGLAGGSWLPVGVAGCGAAARGSGHRVLGTAATVGCVAHTRMVVSCSPMRQVG